MSDDFSLLRIPSDFVDYTRRLIVYSDVANMQERFGILLHELEKYGISENIIEFDIGPISVRAVYLANQAVTVPEVIADLRLQFHQFRFEQDSRSKLLAFPPNDALYPKQWALRAIGAEAAWARVNELRPLRAVKVAIIDSGVMANHEDLVAAGITGQSVIFPYGSALVDDTGHGTMIAGIIRAVSGNTKGIAGAAQDVHVLAVKITDESQPPTALASLLGIAVALLSNADVINLSWHVLDSGVLLREALNFVGQLGCVVVVAAGNYGSNNTEIPTLPASYALTTMVVAMASDEHDDKCWFSNYGSSVDLAAPGIRVLSTGMYHLNSRYPSHSGTSVSSAYVSAAAALLLAIDSWTPEEIRQHLNASADPVHSLSRICRSGGRINLRRAVCGPFKVTNPTGGEEIPTGSPMVVQWATEYTTPVVGTVEVSLMEAATGNVLISVGAQPSSGSRTLMMPATATSAFIRVKAEAKNLYTDSATFDLV